MSTPWSGSAILSAARHGDIGLVIRLVRKATGLTQAELGAACGYSQPVVSRIERGQRHAYDIRVLQQIAQVLDLPPQLLGLAESDAPELPVNRRDFLTSAGALAASTLLPYIPPTDDTTAATFRIITASQRRLDGTLPSRDLAESVLAHLRMTRRVASETKRNGHRGHDLAEAASEVAGFAGWLHWDMHDLGSARRYYDLAVHAATASGNGVLAAYMTGSLASFAAEQGDSAESLNLIATAHRQLGDDRPAIAEAWLCSVSAVAHASAHDERSAFAALDRSEEAAGRILTEHSPPWPWVFSFDPAKVAAHRLACAVRLGRVNDALQGARDAGLLLAAPTRQAALWRLDHATAYLEAGHVDRAFQIATDVLDSTAASQSARVLNKARALRRHFTALTPSGQVQEFDERLRAARL